MAKSKDPIVVVGGGRAAASMVDSYREAGGDALITIFSIDRHPPYNRPPLSKAILRGEMEPDGAIAHTADEYDELLVELRLETTVTSVDPKAHSIALEGGETIEYGTLVIACGTQPRTLDIPGADLPAVHTFRTLDDATTVAAEAADARKALVVGGSFIGSEVAASLRMLGLEVTIVEMGERLTPAFASEELSQQVADMYREQGVDVILGESIAELKANGRMLTGARTESGREIEAFLAVIGVGVRPNVGFLEGSGLEIDDGIVVDDHFRTSVPDIYALGDVAQFDDAVAGRRRRIEHWSSADNQGRHLGAILAGSRSAYAELAVFFTKLFDVQLQVIGDPGGGVDEVVLRGSVGDRNLLGFYLRDGRLVGAVVAGQGEDMVEELKTLIRDNARLNENDHGRLTNEHVRPRAIFA
jgi:3-phenylpropionate/trans-cinnamate dioxygenase ferredoxin reductase component